MPRPPFYIPRKSLIDLCFCSARDGMTQGSFPLPSHTGLPACCLLRHTAGGSSKRGCARYLVNPTMGTAAGAWVVAAIAVLPVFVAARNTITTQTRNTIYDLNPVSRYVLPNDEYHNGRLTWAPGSELQNCLTTAEETPTLCCQITTDPTFTGFPPAIEITVTSDHLPAVTGTPGGATTCPGTASTTRVCVIITPPPPPLLPPIVPCAVCAPRAPCAEHATCTFVCAVGG